MSALRVREGGESPHANKHAGAKAQNQRRRKQTVHACEKMNRQSYYTSCCIVESRIFHVPVVPLSVSTTLKPIYANWATNFFLHALFHVIKHGRKIRVAFRASRVTLALGLV
jgi:hypothetical protein